MTTEEEDPRAIKTQRDCLLKIVKQAQDDAARAERIICLLILAGHVDEKRVNQAGIPLLGVHVPCRLTTPSY